MRDMKRAETGGDGTPLNLFCFKDLAWQNDRWSFQDGIQSGVVLSPVLEGDLIPLFGFVDARRL